MPVQLSDQDIMDLKKQGFSDQQISKAIQEVNNEELEEARAVQQPNQSGRASSFSSPKTDDMARFQIELNDLLEQFEHVLRGDEVKFEEGKRIWIDNPRPEENPLNDHGVKAIMSEIQTYVNKHIILGDYEQQDINLIMRQYSRKIRNWLFLKAEEFGMNTDLKRTYYTSIVMNVVNIVYASYVRAKDGAERRSLREMINVGIQQSSGMMQNGQVMSGQPRVRGVLNPMRYVLGKHV